MIENIWIVIADSDDINYTDQCGTPTSGKNYVNVYSTYPIEYYDGYWHMMNYYNDRYDNIIDNISVLKYYSQSAEAYKEIYGTKDLINYHDFYGYNQEIYNEQNLHRILSGVCQLE